MGGSNQQLASARRDRIDLVVSAVLRSHGGAASPQAVESVAEAAGFGPNEVRGSFERLHLVTTLSPRNRVLWCFRR